MIADFIYRIENQTLICGLTIGETSVRHTVGGWHDGLQELLCIACEAFGKFEEQTACFQEEPGTFLWRITRLESNRVRVRVVGYSYDWWAEPRTDDPGKLLFDHSCGVVSFAKAIYKGSGEWLATLERLGRHDEAGSVRNSRNRLSEILKKFDFSGQN